MKISFRTASAPALLLAALSLALPVSAQQDESGAEDEKWGQLIVEYGTWVAESGGLGENVATIVDPTNVFGDTLAGFERGTRTEDYSRLGAELAGNRGRLMLTWYAHDDDARLGLRDPGNFIFGQLLSHQTFAGLSNDGLADAVDATRMTQLRDLRVEYSRVAFSNSRVVGRWFGGYRRVTFRNRTDASYYALVPTFPAFVPPLVTALPELTPLPEAAELISNYEGAGVSGGMEFEASVWRDKFVIEGSFGLALLQGTVDTGYRSTNHYYELAGAVLNPPYSELADYTVNSLGFLIGTATSVTQETSEIGLRAASIARNSQVFEVSLGARIRALRYMDVFFGYRTHHYAGVGVDLRPRNTVTVGNTSNTTDGSEVDRSATFRGFYGGIGFHF